MKIQYTVTPELGKGYGGIDSPNRMTDKEANVFAELVRNQFIVTVEVGTPAGCIDGRGVLHNLDGSESKVGMKTAGGSAVSALVARELTTPYDSEANVYVNFATGIRQLEVAKKPTRFHIDQDHEEFVMSMLKQSEEKFAGITDLKEFVDAVTAWEFDDDGTGCGMDDQLTGAVSNMARVPRTYKDENGVVQTETPEQVETR